MALPGVKGLSQHSLNLLSTKENDYICGGENHEEDAAKEKVLFVAYAPVEGIISFVLSFHVIDLE